MTEPDTREIAPVRARSRPATATLIRRTTQEWPPDPAKVAALDTYLDRWMFDVLGLDRRIGREF